MRPSREHRADSARQVQAVDYPYSRSKRNTKVRASARRKAKKRSRHGWLSQPIGVSCLAVNPHAVLVRGPNGYDGGSANPRKSTLTSVPRGVSELLTLGIFIAHGRAWPFTPQL